MEKFDHNLFSKESSKSNKRIKKDNKTQIFKYSDNLKMHKSCSNKNNNLIKNHILDKNSLNKENKSNNIYTSNCFYKHKLLDIFNDFLDKKKFKLSNNFNEKNSKKFSAKKDKYLERIIK